MAGRLDEAVGGDDGNPYDIDKWNNARIAERHARALEDILGEAARNRETLIAAMERLEDGHLGGTLKFPGDAKRPPAEVPFNLFLAGWARHDPIHAADMLKALPERTGDAALLAWLDDPAVKWYQSTMAGPERSG